jgi:predicted metal-dependent hydrolase
MTDVTWEISMSDTWQYQIRVKLAPHYAQMARTDPHNAALTSLNALLERHRAHMKCQFDAFADYVAQAEREGTEHYPLYRWTRETIENPVKQAKYLEAFTLYVDGDEVYDRALADALENDLRALASEAVVEIRKLDTNPANSPQPPAYGKQ